LTERRRHVDVSVVLQIDGIRALSALQVRAPAGQNAWLRKRGALVLRRVAVVWPVAVEVSSNAANTHTAAQSSIEVIAIVVGRPWLLVAVTPVRVAPAALLVVVVIVAVPTVSILGKASGDKFFLKGTFSTFSQFRLA
jgi:hypothetical protein